MGWTNPPIPWSELERTLSGRPHPERARPGQEHSGQEHSGQEHPQQDRPQQDRPGRAGGATPEAAVPAPGASRKAAGRPVVPYAELHVHSHYSFLDGSSSPESLVAEASRLGLHALALTDHDGLYGIVRMAEAADAAARAGERAPGAHPLKTVFGAELSLGLPAPQNGQADPVGSHLLVLARGRRGYHRLSSAITAAQLADGAEKGSPRYDLEALAGAAHGDWVILTGCRKGAVRRALEADLRSGDGPDGHGAAAAERELDRLVQLFGRDNVVVELIDHDDPLDDIRNDLLAEIARRAGLPTIASNNVHYARPDDRRLADAMAAVRARRSLDDLDGWLPAAGRAHLRSGAEQAARFARHPGAVERTVELADQTAFELRSAAPRLPKTDVPAGHTPMSWLRELVRRGVAEKYPGAREGAADDPVWSRIRKELAVIEAKDFPGYFLIVHDIVCFARGRGILCQGRGSAANSAVCYVLGITAVDSIFYRLPFERFLSSIRDEEPDIDVDFDSDRREEVIQYVYARYGRRNAAQVADVISYRPKFAVRDMAKALGHGPGRQDAWSKRVDSWTRVEPDDDIPAQVTDLAGELLKAPRHLGIHSGGMVLTERPVSEVCPVEHARMEGRTVLQWDKEDCEWMGLVKFDLLGLGMLAALQYVFDLVDEHLGERWELAGIPKEEPAVYDMLCRADTVGVFQVESRAQMGTLPRLRPRRFYDLVIEIALIRPGPIQGGAVHPYIRRRTGAEPVEYLHPALEPVLERTLGVPLFQEQLMQMAMAVGGCSAEDADLLRRAMGSKRGVERITTLRKKLYDGMAANGIVGEDADAVYEKIAAFANFGFAESHSLAFALLVYASSWLKLHYPAAFLAALLRAQPMGFYAPHTLVADARRHGVEVRHVDILRSGADAILEPLSAHAPAGAGPATPTGLDSCLRPDQPPVGGFDAAAPDTTPGHRRDGGFAVRLGLAGVDRIGAAFAARIVAEREASGPFLDLGDVARRTGANTLQLESLAAAGAFESLGLGRREAMWNAGWAAGERAEQLIGSAVAVQPPLLPLLSPAEQTVYDLWATGISPDSHPLQHVREPLDARGVVPIAATRTTEAGRRIEVAGAVTHRQRPSTAGGVTFLNIEDETGILNVIVGVGVWRRFSAVARRAPAMIVRGILERSPEGVTNLLADRLEALPLTAPVASRDFR